MIDVVTHLDIDRPAADVFAFVSDQLNAPRWQRGLHEVRRTTGGPIGVGTEHVFVRRFAGRRIESRNRFVEFEPGRSVAFEIPDGAITGRASYLVEPVVVDRCRVTSTMRFDVSRWMRLAEPCWPESCNVTADETSKHSSGCSSPRRPDVTMKKSIPA